MLAILTPQNLESCIILKPTFKTHTHNYLSEERAPQNPMSANSPKVDPFCLNSRFYTNPAPVSVIVQD